MKKLTFKNALIDLVLTGFMGSAQFFYIFILLLFTYGIFTCGNAWLTLWFNIRNGLIFATVVLGIQLIVTYYLYRSRTLILATGLWLVTVSSLYPVIVLACDAFNYSHYYQEFDKEVWNKSKEKPLSMIREFYEDKRYIGKTREAVIGDLGPGDSTSWWVDSDNLSYITDDYYSPLVFKIENGVVVDYYLECLD